MKQAKYKIENSLAMRGGFRQLVQQVDFDDPDVKSLLKRHPCHIYMICSRPRITFIADRIKISKQKYSVGFMIHSQAASKTFEAEFENHLGYVSFDLSKSGNRIKLLGEDGKVITEGRAGGRPCVCAFLP